MVMGYDGEGRCPMLGAAGCRIYEHRPRTCRAYDCRVYGATDVTPEQPLVAERVRDWSFTDPPDRRTVVAAARRLGDEGVRPTEAAVRAVAGD
jgi:Fe-S-cluster containining protein